MVSEQDGRLTILMGDICCSQGEGFGMSEEFSFMTGPEVGPDAEIRVLANADMGHAEPDGSNEFEYDRNARLVSILCFGRPYCLPLVRLPCSGHPFVDPIWNPSRDSHFTLTFMP